MESHGIRFQVWRYTENCETQDTRRAEAVENVQFSCYDSRYDGRMHVQNKYSRPEESLNTQNHNIVYYVTHHIILCSLVFVCVNLLCNWAHVEKGETFH